MQDGTVQNSLLQNMKLNISIWNWFELLKAELVHSDLINFLWIIQIDKKKKREMVPHLQVCYQLPVINYIYYLVLYLLHDDAYTFCSSR